MVNFYLLIPEIKADAVPGNYNFQFSCTIYPYEIIDAQYSRQTSFDFVVVINDICNTAAFTTNHINFWSDSNENIYSYTSTFNSLGATFVIDTAGCTVTYTCSTSPAFPDPDSCNQLINEATGQITLTTIDKDTYPPGDYYFTITATIQSSGATKSSNGLMQVQFFDPCTNTPFQYIELWDDETGQLVPANATDYKVLDIYVGASPKSYTLRSYHELYDS